MNINWVILGKAIGQVIGVVALILAIAGGMIIIALYFSTTGLLIVFLGWLVAFLVYNQYMILKSRHDFDEKWGKK